MDILLLSDQEQLLEKSSLALDEVGHEVVSVLQDHQAAEYLERDQFDIVIIDINIESTSRMMIKDLVKQLQVDCEIVDGHLDGDIIAQIPGQTE